MDAFEIIRKTMNEFAEVSDDTIQAFISLAEPLISKKRFRKLYPQALAYLAAHKMKMSGLGKTIGIGTIGDTIGLSSVSEGETSVSFSNNQAGNTATDSEFGLTVYGMQYLNLRKRCIVTIVSAGKVREKVTADGKKFQKMLEDLDKLEVRIGIQQGAGSDNGVDLVDIAMFNELGTVHIPSRPFLRDSVDAHSSEINAFLQSMRTQLVKGGSAEDTLKKIGVFQKGLIQKEIVNGDFVPNSPETIKRKGSDKPLIDTGRMRQSINYVIQEKGGSD